MSSVFSLVIKHSVIIYLRKSQEGENESLCGLYARLHTSLDDHLMKTVQ
jgi:hypothetical protein